MTRFTDRPDVEPRRGGVPLVTVAGFSRWMRRLAPWAVAAVVIALLLSRYSPEAIAAELARGEVLAMVPWVVAISLGALILMVVADWLVFATALGARRGSHRLHVLDVARGRAATGILMSLHHGLSSGGYVVWLGRRTGVGAGATVGAATYQLLSDLGAVCLIALPSALLGAELLPAGVGASAAALAACGLVGVSALLLFGPRVTPRRWRESRMVVAWTRVPASVWAVSTVLRAATIAINIVGTWGAARAFGLSIPFEALAAGLPIAYLVGALPINVFGLGAVQAAWVVLFERHAPGAQILAFQFVFQLLGAAAQVVRGLPFLPGVLRDLESGPRQRPTHEPEGMILP
jgi:Lysylphosphatidylglycerol synthase TM region